MSFTPLQRLVAQVTLEAIADLGFALGGGLALHAHGLGDRLSLDLDFYVTRFDQDLFDRAEAATLAGLRDRGYVAEVGHSDTWLRQILVTDPHSGDQVVLDLGQDYRQHPPILITGLGPVIDLPDAAASKARALNDRRAARDYLDIHALLTQTGWTPQSLFAALRDNLRPVITVAEFAADLAAAGDQDPEDYHAYGLTDADITRLAADFTHLGGPTTRHRGISSMTTVAASVHRLRSWAVAVALLLSTLVAGVPPTSMEWPGSQALCADVAVTVAVNPDHTPTTDLLDYRITAGHSHGPPAIINGSASNGHTYYVLAGATPALVHNTAKDCGDDNLGEEIKEHALDPAEDARKKVEDLHGAAEELGGSIDDVIESVGPPPRHWQRQLGPPIKLRRP